jgi:hypothetical protein
LIGFPQPPKISPNHFLTIPQQITPAASLKMVNKLVAKELHFGHPFPPLFCYPVSITLLYLGVLGGSNAFLCLFSLRLCGSMYFSCNLKLVACNFCMAVALAGPSAETVPIQRPAPSLPPTQNVNSAHRSLTSARHFSG